MKKIFLIKEIILFIVGISIIINAHKILLIILGSIFTILSILENGKIGDRKSILDIILGGIILIGITNKYSLLCLFIIWLIVNSIYIFLDYITNEVFQSIFKVVIGIMSIVLAIFLIIKPINNQNLFPIMIAIYFIASSIINIGIWLIEKVRYN